MEFTDFIIKIRSLKNGTQVFEYNLDGSFFAEFGNSIILDASLRAFSLNFLLSVPTSWSPLPAS